MTKPPAKTPAKTPALRTPRHGKGKLRRGGPNGGAGGRPPNEFKRAMAELASNDEMLAHVQKVLGNPDHPQWLGAWKWATERGYGKVPQAITGADGGPLLIQALKPEAE